MAVSNEHLRRWRLILGGHEADGTGYDLQGSDLAMDRCLHALYDAQRTGGLGGSAPNVARWLGDIRQYFPTPIVRVMQQDALDRLGLQRMLLEPEMLAAVEADVHLVATLLSLSRVIPERTKDTARQVVRRVVEELERKLANPLRQAVTGSLNRAQRNNRRPRHSEIDWDRTIRANLKHYQPAYRTIIPQTRIGFGRKTTALRDVILCVDQSGSMATSVVYSGILAAVLASIRALKTQMVVFDTAVVDLTEKLSDPVEVLFGTQLGGGTDINQALSYCQHRVSKPQDTILVLISDLYEGGDRQEMIKRSAALVAAGVQMIALLALDDRGAPSFDHALAATLAGLGVPAFACTPELFPDLMAAAINRHDINAWAAAREIVVAGAGTTGK
ncbi:MAG: VWA domain-containing protein [Gammaproteobacteria bacterium]|nr:VWA domain-containing protein [Gammaproteobacteria bacterium]MCP5423692.1 VWA domain-containing protein [Gammaproteobacteria bacterium]